MSKHLILAIFAATTLLAVLREWSAPVACPLPTVRLAIRTVTRLPH